MVRKLECIDDLGIGIHPEDVWILVAISVAELERDLGLSHTAEPGDGDTAACAGLGPFLVSSSKLLSISRTSSRPTKRSFRVSGTSKTVSGAALVG